MRTARLRPGAGVSAATKRLDAYHGTGHVPVGVDVTCTNHIRGMFDPRIDSRVNAERQPKTGRTNVAKDIIKVFFSKPRHVQDGAEVLTVEVTNAANLNHGRCDKPIAAGVRQGCPVQQSAPGARSPDVGLQRRCCLRRNDRPDIRRQSGRVTDPEFVHGTPDELDRALGDIVL